MKRLTSDQLRELAAALDERDAAPVGDGQGVFLSDMSEDEYDAYRHENEHGWKGFMDRVRGLSGDPRDDV